MSRTSHVLRVLAGIMCLCASGAEAAEQFRDVTVERGIVLDSRGGRLRTFTSFPKGKGRLPAVLVVGWLSCDSMEVQPAARDGTSILLRQVIEQSGALVMRIDKPGVGESEGNCAETDFTTELSGYRAAFAALKSDVRVDPERILILGISNGGGIAPLVTEGTRVAGYVSVDGWSKTWFEHMIELERRRLGLAGRPASERDADMKGFILFYAGYLLERRTPIDVIAGNPDLKALWYDEPAHQYGRPAVFYHQLQSLDLAAAWSTVDAPTLVVWGEYDWIMSREDQQQIVDLVNLHRKGHAQLLVVPAMDHGFSTHPGAKAAFDNMGNGAYPRTAAAEIIRFMRRQLAGR